MLGDRAGLYELRPRGGALEIPQVGDISFEERPDGTVGGHTDQGCSWSFVERLRGLELASTDQKCFNEVIGSSYTMKQWPVGVDGDQETGTIIAVGHLPTGDYDLVLANRRRTRSDEHALPRAPALLEGTWEYVPADPATQVNVVLITQDDQTGVAPQTGEVTSAPGERGEVTATTAVGRLHLALAARGNTAQLDPRDQECELSDATRR
jgi:hypothetical protein